ncbi:diphthamide biosynthesis protein 4 [Aspergillus tanneri]|uniref:Diphthamide biosynthesis protein 4 n=1 Tax=Aspergillus tanneri TaxID=1220188 RepID=A0A5M9MWF8_9EURO|nr:Diphthamide biosynthesis protein 4 [Aspergillus tanneri]KAA8648929.1 Diphthamide biosynthesis protein 4 [Aspergillus tanneri]
MTRSQALAHDHYEILNLPFTGTPTALSKQQLKIAYHKALLKHHPDKASMVAKDAHIQVTRPSSPSSTFDSSHASGRIYTIDEITAAYKTLSDPRLRAEYDRCLRLDRSKISECESTGTVFHTGLEVVDLEDLVFDDGDNAAKEEGQMSGAIWYRGCRCGDERGFQVTEDDLARESEHGDIVIGCRGCSLWTKILFAVEDGDNGGYGEEEKKT